MAYRLKLSEPVGKGVRRIALEQIDRALTSLAGGMDGAAAVHDARKCLKRTRALLRLVRPALGEREFRSHADRLRDTARLLSGARDAHVARLTLDQLASRYPLAGAGDLQLLRSGLAGEEGAEDAAAPSSDVLEQAIAGLTEARAAIEKLELPGRSFDTLGAGLTSSFADFGRALDRIGPGSVDEEFHELRKHAQIHWRHMLLLRRAWPDWIAVRAALARTLSDRLGEDHDLSVLRAKATALSAEPAFLSALDAAIADRQSTLRARAVVEARLLAVERPKGLSRRLAGYWRAARELRALAVKEKRAAEAATGATAPAAAEPSSSIVDVSGPASRRSQPAVGRSSRRRRVSTA